MHRPQPLRYDHYKVLGIERSASLKEIKQAYRARVKTCHPDKNTSPQAASLFLLVHEAYSELCDPVRRRSYDERLQFYRHTTTGQEHGARNPSTWRTHGTRSGGGSQSKPAERFAFVGLHVTGLCFGSALVAGILVGIVFFAWPPSTLFFCLPGIALIPDSLAGIRMK